VIDAPLSRCTPPMSQHSNALTTSTTCLVRESCGLLISRLRALYRRDIAAILIQRPCISTIVALLAYLFAVITSAIALRHPNCAGQRSAAYLLRDRSAVFESASLSRLHVLLPKDLDRSKRTSVAVIVYA